MAFSNASGCNFHTVTINDVKGNQINNNYNQIIHQERKRTIYDEFYNIKLGAIHHLRDVYHENYPRRWDVGIREWWEEGRLRVNRTICTAEIHSDSSGSKFTVVSYNGPEANQAWEEDFRWSLQSRNAQNMQLFGLNRSNIPMLIFYNELMPLAYRWDQLHALGKFYFFSLARNLECNERELWMDFKHGNLIHGVEGPQNAVHFFSSYVNTPSSSIELLQHHVLWNYLSSFPLQKEFDIQVLYVLERSSRRWIDTNSRTIRPIISSARTRTIAIAVGGGVWRCLGKCFDSRAEMVDGKTRFTVVNDSEYFGFRLRSSTWEACAWLSQASSVFHKLSILPDEDLSQYELIRPNIQLSGQMVSSEITQQRRSTSPPIYLFVLPIYRSSSIPYFWSHSETGQTRIPRKMCKRLGLPTKLSVHIDSPFRYSWPTETYREIHRWQVLRGFDPRTTSFARYLGSPVYDIIHRKSSQFEELDADLDEGDLSLDLLFHDTDTQIEGDH
ncbi:hypothetical protein E1B28_005285 [Marasmius oreades]|uniref:Uncharacterized protein n=1 Tax=Marasmius oreades TaxID=181124 RepID=A0A9P8ADN9_9AGAR|nr:uncharacterized protein E1B28_005285 [Marasmius oreades]KAG7097976.1 hypothetical protein E1B28_005285 [Marasmius oreades]